MCQSSTENNHGLRLQLKLCIAVYSYRRTAASYVGTGPTYFHVVYFCDIFINSRFQSLSLLTQYVSGSSNSQNEA